MAIKTDTFSSAGGGAGTDNLDDVTSRGATTTNAITVGGVTVGTEYSLPTLDGSANQVLQTNGTGTVSFATLDFTGGLEYKGAFNATAGTPSLLNAEKGDFYIIDTAGTIYGQTWAVGDHLLINEDMGGTITNSKIDKIDNTDTPASETVAGVIEIATNAEATAGTATDKALVPSNISSLDLSAMDNTTSAFITVGDIPTASHSTAGILETATNAEATSATANDKILTPANLSHIDLSTFDNDSGFISNITGESLNDLSDVSFTAGAGIDNYVLTYDNATTSWGAEAVPSASAASETVAGVIEIATNAEATAGTATDKALVPSNLSSVDLSVLDNTTSAFITSGDIPTASETTAGVIEIATNAEAGAGTATDKALVPSNISSLDLSAMDNTTSAFISDITSESLNDLSDVSFTAGAGIDNYVLTYDNGTSTWGAEAVPSASPASETTAGIIEIATNAEATAGTATDKALVPSNISSLDLSAMDNTTSAFISDITGESLNDLSDVSYTAGAGIDNYVLTYDNSTSSWGAEASAGGSPASETTAGIIEIATNAEATAGTATDKALVPSNLSSVDLSVLDNTTSAFITAGDIPTASETVAGVIEIATNAEAGAGTATDKALVPSNISSLDLSAMDNTTSGFISGITSESLNDLSDVSFTAGAGIDNYVLTYDHATTSWGAEAAAGGGEYTVSTQGSADFSASNNTFYYVNTASGTTTTVTLPGRTFSATNERIKFFNHGNGTLRVQETSGTARIHPDESGNDPGGSGQTYKDIGSRSVIEFIGIPNTYQWEWAISAQLELGKDTLSSDGEVLRYDSASDQMTALPYTFPTSDGSANQILKTDGAGALTFIDQPGGSAPDVVTDSSGTNTTISTTTGVEEVHLISNGANNVSITIPAASTAGEGYKYQVKRLGTGTVSVAPSSGTIDGAASFSLASQYDSVTVVSDNSNWFII